MIIVEERRFFSTTRGRIVAELRRCRRASAHELAERFELSTNAIRRHLSSLQEQGLVTELAVRRGRTKPTFEFTLTEEAEDLFPQRYDRLLNAVLREVRTQYGVEGIRSVFAGIVAHSLERYGPRLAEVSGGERVAELAQILREQGVDASIDSAVAQEGGQLIVLHEHSCPYAKTVAEHPEVCSMVHGLLDSGHPGTVRQTASLATGDGSCRFEILEGTSKNRERRL